MRSRRSCLLLAGRLLGEPVLHTGKIQQFLMFMRVLWRDADILMECVVQHKVADKKAKNT